MKCSAIVLPILLLAAAQAAAQETTPYPNGTSGLKAGTVPPPGHYYLMYNRLYRADQTNDVNGHAKTGPDGEPLGFALEAFANVHRLIHITDYTILGANYGWNIVMPVVNVDVSIAAFGIDAEACRIGDMNMEPFVLEWHKPRYDFGYVFGFFAPTAQRSATNPALPGKAFWTPYFGAAGTYYFDEEKTWTISFLSRYEMPSKRRDLDVRPGDNFSFEWGFGKSFDQSMNVGVSGYCSWQTTDDEGTQIALPVVRDRVFGAGPEVDYFSAKYKFGYQFRFWWEFGAHDRTQGTIATLTFIKPF